MDFRGEHSRLLFQKEDSLTLAGIYSGPADTLAAACWRAFSPPSTGAHTIARCRRAQVCSARGQQRSRPGGVAVTTKGLSIISGQ
jgi:hypothetical protein